MESKTHVIVATGDWDQDHLRYRRHRLAEFLLKQRDTEEVIWVCPTTGKQSFQKLSNGIVQYGIPDVHSHKLFRFGRYFDLFYKHKLKALQAHLQSKGTKKYLWYTFPGFPAIQKLIDWETTTYDCSDLWASSMTGKKNIVLKLREQSIVQAEERIVRTVDKLFATSDFLNDYLVKTYNPAQKPLTLENGVEYHLFEERVKLSKGNDLSGSVIGYIGGIKPKLDFDLLNEVMKRRGEWTLLLAGPDGTNGDPTFHQLLQNENVKYLGKIQPNEVPAWLNKIDIGLLPYKPSEYNKAVFPLKLFEYLAAGKPIVGYNLPSTKKYQQEWIYEYGEGRNVDEFIAHCSKLLADNNEKHVEDRKKLAESKDWNNIFKKMYMIVVGK
ncbi:teichuronic acid biosynthesis protein TuaH [Sutcliffiella cohnii]|uniref:teichuronic acid biosynthesis protein TuaH n=1 Tax=Sutcliffiella cohnii TaxID=33932 RepID=UPI002E208A75|nr:glycosyltransferase [Sutcliffiella cohnii]